MAKILVFASCFACVFGLPSLQDSVQQPMLVRVGHDALLTCVVRDLMNSTLLWKLKDTVLTAAENRVTDDSRFNILHDEGGDVWVLVIKNVRASDDGTYTCEVNSQPVLRSFHTVHVVGKKRLVEEASSAEEKPTLEEEEPSSIEEVASVGHNYTECCQQNNVSSACLGFCSLKSILDGTTGQDPDLCELDFPNIVKCMTDGRNHVPCCVNEGVPEVCQDICRGEYNIPKDDISTHASCAEYTEPTLACIAVGIEILPSAPETVVVDSKSETSLKVSWSQPLQNLHSITHYLVNISALPGFDTLTYPMTSPPTDAKKTKDGKKSKPFSAQFKVKYTENSTIIANLSPFVMYEITVTSYNRHGSSLASLKMRSLTSTEETNKTMSQTAPALPDIKECCTSKGIYHSRCVNKFCDPIRTSEVSLPDLMICAPWASESFSCLANGIDHSDCCRSRGLPPPCIQLCTGNISRIDFNQFRCVQYMDELSNCLLQGYGVLPSAPLSLRVSNLNPTFAVLRWDVPKTLGQSVVSYNVRYRATISAEDGDDTSKVYHLVNTKSVPFILEKLEADTEYEIYVSAVNDHGVGLPSARILFVTQMDDSITEESSSTAYNVTSCCHSVNINAMCMPLCDYSAKFSELKLLTQSCSSDFPKLLRCSAGGRNHIGCCQRRGVPKECSNFCTGHVTEDALITSAACIPFMSDIMQCFQEGTDLLPGPINQMHATAIGESSVTLVWEPSAEGHVDHYVVHYKMIESNVGIDNPIMNFELDEQVNVSDTVAVIAGLEANKLYKFFVLAANDHGTSLPSSVLTLNLTQDALANGTIMGVPSPPGEISITSRSTDYLVISWQHPRLAHPTDRLRYKFHFRKMNTKVFTVIETSMTSYRVDNLTASAMHIIYLTAVNDNGESMPSETLLAWTDPAIEPWVEVPTIHPSTIVLEGGSMTVVCVAQGSPMPTVTLYVSGVMKRKERTRHMVVLLSNVTRKMDQISCHADNGYGPPAQASKRINIGRRPQITASLVTLASMGDDVTLTCSVDAHPPPTLGFTRDANALEQIGNSTKYQVAVKSRSRSMDAVYTMVLTIRNMESSDSGVYYCNAQNSFGTFSQALKLQARKKIVRNDTSVAQCCANMNVTSTCMDACSLFLDIDSVINRPECINDFHKLIKCAADGSDHRGCCSKWGVPRRCLDWCRGEPVSNANLCSIAYTKPIMACFHESRDTIPGPPTNVRIQLQEDNSIVVVWDAPLTNPDKVELYRVFWRPRGMKLSDKNDTKATSLRIVGLKENTPYELVVKSGNYDGTSKLTEPISFTLSDKYIISASTRRDNTHAGVVVGVVCAIAVIALAVVAAVWLLRKRNILGKGGVIFDSKTFMVRGFRGASDTQQIVANDSLDVTGSAEVNATITAAQPSKKQENLRASAATTIAPQQTEVNPTMMEELRLGTHGAGFKRFK